jgi:chromosome segregation ATPase
LSAARGEFISLTALDLLRSYRIAHARAISIEPFEKALKEHTPLATIGDPDALVEYLNQLNLKGDMVMDELKRVSADRDDYKKRFEAAEKEKSTTKEELATVRASMDGSPAATEKADVMSIDTPTASVKSPSSSVLGIFSPKQKAKEVKDTSEEFFSFDDEIPKLQTEVREKTVQVEELKSKVSTLEKDLATAKESSSGLVESLEKATRELNESKDVATEAQARQKTIDAQTAEISALKENLQITETQLAALEANLARQRKESEEKVTSLETNFASQKDTTDKSLKSQIEARREAETVRETLDAQIKELELAKAIDVKRIHELSEEVKSLNKQVEEATSHEAEESTPNPVPATETAPAGSGTGAAKKKNKKKKKGGATAAAAKGESTEKPDSTPPTPTPTSIELHAEIAKLKEEVADRDAQIAKLQTKRKTEADLREELENMQDNFLNIGQEHVEAKEKIKELQNEKTGLEKKIMNLEAEIEMYKSQSKDSGKIEENFKSLTAEYEDLKVKSATLQTDLGAAQQLATSRYRDLTELREVLQKAQPELKTLRAEVATLKTIKDELGTKTSELRRLEAREKDLKSDLAAFKKQAADRDNELRTLNEKITQETNSRLRSEDATRIAQRDMRKSEAEKIQLSASSEKASAELARLQDELSKLRPRVHELENQVSKLTAESKGLREEVELRGSQYNNAQGLLGSMRDQAGEMAMQLKEAKEQSESLEEELAEVQRLLSERTREGETMRRLLADVDNRADAKVREMRERMEAAIEERDRAEDEASTNGRRRAREVDELKSRIRDFERDLKRANDEREDLERAEKEWKRKRDELESSAEGATKEVREVRSAMTELRDALDGSEKSVRDAEKQRAELRRMLDEANVRYEKLSKEFKAMQAKQKLEVSASGRSSIDSGSTGVRSPINGSGGGGAAQAGKMDYVYLKTILLQFLEQRDKKRQADLVKTVLGQLLHFDKYVPSPIPPPHLPSLGRSVIMRDCANN